MSGGNRGRRTGLGGPIVAAALVLFGRAATGPGDPHAWIDEHLKVLTPADVATARDQGKAGPLLDVYQEDGLVRVRTNSCPRFCTLDIGGGLLVGVDRGEFGCGLSFLSYTAAESYSLGHIQVVAITNWAETIVVLSRKDRANSGHLFQVVRDKGDARYVIERMMSFDSEPAAFVALDERRALVITRKGVSLVSRAGKMSTVLEHRGDAWAWPTSAVLTTDRCLYVGMSKYAVRIRLNPAGEGALSEEWLAPRPPSN